MFLPLGSSSSGKVGVYGADSPTDFFLSLFETSTHAIDFHNVLK